MENSLTGAPPPRLCYSCYNCARLYMQKARESRDKFLASFAKSKWSVTTKQGRSPAVLCDTCTQVHGAPAKVFSERRLRR